MPSQDVSSHSDCVLLGDEIQRHRRAVGVSALTRNSVARFSTVGGLRKVTKIEALVIANYQIIASGSDKLTK